MNSESFKDLESVQSEESVLNLRESVSSSSNCGYRHSIPNSLHDDPERLSIKKTISRKIGEMVSKTFDDDDTDVNTILRSKFDVHDAFLLHDNRDQELTDDTGVVVTTGFERKSRVGDVESSMTSSSEKLHDTFGNNIDDSGDKGPIVERVFTNKSSGQVNLPPDGGYGWVSALCTFLTMFSSWGCNSSFGVILAFYLNNTSFPNANKYDYALIAGMTVFFGQVCAPFVMILMRVIGFKVTMIIGLFLNLAAFLLASFATKLWHLYITQGFLFGVSLSLIFIPATTVIPGWFLKKRAVAMGISLMGTGIGGMVYGLAVNKMIQDDGNTRWAFRMLGIVSFITLTFSIIFIKQYNPSKPIGIRSFTKIKREFHLMFQLRIIKKPFVPLIALWFGFALFGYNLMIFTLSSYAVAKGLSQHDGSTLTAILNAGQAIGRPSIGLLGDRYGRVNITIVLTVLNAIFMFAFWIPAHTMLQLIFFSTCLGLCIGVANVMNTVLIADLVGPEDFLPSWAFVNYCTAPMFLVVELIAQALVDNKAIKNPYLHTQIFAGLCFVVALFLILILREVAVRLKLEASKKLLEKHIKNIEIESKNSLTVDSNEYQIELTKVDDDLGPGFKKYIKRLTSPIII